jgi:hypothetical protein
MPAAGNAPVDPATAPSVTAAPVNQSELVPNPSPASGISTEPPATPTASQPALSERVPTAAMNQAQTDGPPNSSARNGSDYR